MSLVAAHAGMDADYANLAVVLATVSALFALERPRLAIAAFALAAPLPFMKFSSGLAGAMLVLGSGVAWGLARRRWSVLLWGASVLLVGGVLVGGLALGSLRGIADWLVLEIQVAKGHSEGMSNPYLTSTHAWAGVLAVGICLAVTGVMALRRSVAAMPLLVAILPLFLAFRHSFGREDEGHLPFVFVFAMSMLAAASLLAQARKERALLASAFVLVTIALGSSWGEAAPRHLDELGNALSGRRLLYEMRILLDLKGARERARAITQAQQSVDALPPEWNEEIRQGGSVTVVPWEMAICAANSLPCVPYPTLQAYVTYTRQLDAWTAATMEARAPAFVIVEPLDLDERSMVFDSPATWTGLLKGWEIARVTPAADRLLLRRRAVPLALQVEPLGQAKAEVGAWLPVPESSPWLQAHLETSDSARGFLRRVLFRPRSLNLELRRASGAQEGFRIVPGTASSGLFLNASPRSGTDLARWFQGEPPRDPVVALRVTGPGAAEVRSRP